MIYLLFFSLAIIIIMCIILWRLSKQPIVIKYKSNDYQWFAISSMTFLISLSFMVATDYITNICGEILEKQAFLNSLINNGLLIVIDMLLLSKIFDIYTKEYNYFVRKYIWLKKVFFTMVCISMAATYYVVLNDMGKITYDAKDFNNSAIWIVVAIQIWVSFAMEPNCERKSVREKLKRIKDDKDYKPILISLLSMFSIVIIYFIYLCFANYIERVMKWYINAASIISVVVVAVSCILFARINKPGEKHSRKTFEKNFSHVKDVEIQGNYRGVKYSMVVNDEKYILKINEINVVLEDNVFSEGQREEALNVFSEKTFEYLIQENNGVVIKEKMESDLDFIYMKRKNMLDKCWDIVYRKK